MSKLQLTTVYRSMGMLSAQVIKGKLEMAGIPVLLKYESAGQIIGLTVDGLGLVEVQVPAECAEDAEALIAERSEEHNDLGGWEEDPAEDALAA